MTAGSPGRPPERVRVRLTKKARNGDLDEDVLWPKGWPFPEPGTVVIGESIGGFVEHVEFHLPSLRLLIVLR